MRTLLLDRDGVINHDSADYIRAPEQWRALPGALEAMARAQHAGFRLIVISNQSGLARGYFSIATLHRIHHKLQHELAAFGARVEAFFFCPHCPQDACGCRKPRTGLFESIEQRLAIDLRGQPFIGDKLSDITAGHAVKARAMMVRTGLNTPELLPPHTEIYADLAAAVDAILTGAKP